MLGGTSSELIPPKLVTGGTARDAAVKPPAFSNPAAANAALPGCVIRDDGAILSWA